MKGLILRTIGITSWLAVFCVVVAGIRLEQQRVGPDTDTSLQHYLFGWQDDVSISDPSRVLRIHDTVFLQQQNGSWVQAGFVQAIPVNSPESVENNSEPPSAIISWHSSDTDPSTCQFLLYRNQGRLEDVVATMLPPEMRLQIQQRLAAAMHQHGDELSAAFVPLVEASLKRSLPIIEEELRVSVKRHRAEIEALGDRWNDEVVSRRLIPLARREIVPIVRTHGEPTAQAIGRELWDRASIWRFGWRAAYDGLPLLPRKDLVQEEWDRFVEQEAVPVFEERMDEIVTSIQKIVADVAANPSVRRELTEVAGTIASDQDTQLLVRQILKETLVDNQRLKDSWRDVWSSEDARRALDLAGDRLEPIVRQIGDDLIGSREQGINPNFARVLRSQILGKDRQWLVAIPKAMGAAVPPPIIEIASDSMPYPIVYLADEGNNQTQSNLASNAAKPSASLPATSLPATSLPATSLPATGEKSTP